RTECSIRSVSRIIRNYKMNWRIWPAVRMRWLSAPNAIAGRNFPAWPKKDRRQNDSENETGFVWWSDPPLPADLNESEKSGGGPLRVPSFPSRLLPPQTSKQNR